MEGGVCLRKGLHNRLLKSVSHGVLGCQQFIRECSRKLSNELQKKRDPASRRAGVKRRKLLFSTKKPRSWVAFLSKAGYSDHLQARCLTPALRGRGRFGIITNRR